MFDIVRHNDMKYAWVGVKDVAGNDVHVIIGSGTVLDDNSNLWWGNNPFHGGRDCVYSYGWDDPPLLIDTICTNPHESYICEQY